MKEKNVIFSRAHVQIKLVKENLFVRGFKQKPMLYLSLCFSSY